MNLKITINGEPVDFDPLRLTVGALGTPPRPGWVRVDEILITTKQAVFPPIDPIAAAALLDPDQVAALAVEFEQRLQRQLRYQEDRLLDNRPFFDVTLRADGELTFTHKPLLPGAP